MFESCEQGGSSPSPSHPLSQLPIATTSRIHARDYPPGSGSELFTPRVPLAHACARVSGQAWQVLALESHAGEKDLPAAGWQRCRARKRTRRGHTSLKSHRSALVLVGQRVGPPVWRTGKHTAVVSLILCVPSISFTFPVTLDLSPYQIPTAGDLNQHSYGTLGEI